MSKQMTDAGGQKAKSLFSRISYMLAVACLAASLAPSQTTPRDGRSKDPAQSASVLKAREIAARGEALLRQWNLEAAAASFREAASIDPSSLDAMIGQARVQRARSQYGDALRLLDKAAKRHKNSPELLAEYGLIYFAAEETGRAREYFDSALKLDPHSTSANIGRAGVDMLLREYRAAEARLRGCLARDPESSRTYVMLARVLLESNQNKQAEIAAQRALALDTHDADALYVLAFIKAAQRKPEEVRALTRRALALDQSNPGARRMLSSYLDGHKGYEQRVPEAARKHYELGRVLKQEGKLDEAVTEFEAALAVEPRYYLALIALGDVWLREGDYERAAAAAKLALDVDPEGALAHLELSYAHLGIRERARIEIGATDFASLFYGRGTPTAFELTAELFPIYRSLTRRQQIVIDWAVAPLAEFLPKLMRSGARHHLLTFDQRVSDARGFEEIGERKTFDGRYYASVRGVGGRITVSGIEYIDTAARGGVHIIAHEFAHQVHMAALDKESTKAIRELYDRAVSEGRTLDFYAAANEYEYFAQGYEAFISTHKRPAAGVTARHTRQELQMRDPSLYKFIEKLTEQSHAMPAQRGLSALGPYTALASRPPAARDRDAAQFRCAFRL